MRPGTRPSRPAGPPRLSGPWLYARSRGLPRAAAALAAVGLLALWAGEGPGSEAGVPGLVAATAFGPLLAAVALAGGLHTAMADAERSASRAWWPRRLAHVLLVTALAAAVLGCAVAGRDGGAAALAVIRDTAGAAGVTAAASVAADARGSWLPVAAYTCAVHLPPPGTPVGAPPWVWPAQPAAEPASWAAAGAALAVGIVLHARRGARSRRP
ncbi:hypothetical protein [Streptomyces genisteinicus]|uniref:hypothetical protein n=1 Tax=Streptomyces genisteinicus TaxID=2768068 RepID=UPI001FE5BB4F|nr:hypothetical protein [Streptomyces genisteinicus]